VHYPESCCYLNCRRHGLRQAGTYNEKVVPENSGSPGNYIVYAAYLGDSITLDGTGITLDWHDALFTIEGKSYIKISGFRIVNSLSPHGSEGIYLKEGMRQDHIIIEKNYFYNIYGPAVGGYSCDNLIIIDTLIYLFPQIFLESQLC